jgi:hypothetical protein
VDNSQVPQVQGYPPCSKLAFWPQIHDRYFILFPFLAIFCPRKMLKISKNFIRLWTAQKRIWAVGWTFLLDLDQMGSELETVFTKK